jgi:hypothetical protein
LPHENFEEHTAMKSKKYSYKVAYLNWILFDLRIRKNLNFYWYCDYFNGFNQKKGKTCYNDSNVLKLLKYLDKNRRRNVDRIFKSIE